MTFPALRPAGYNIEHGTYPASVSQTMSGRTAIVRHSTTETGIRFPAQFIGLTQAQFLDVVAFFEEVGTVESFLLDPVTLPADQTPSGYRWRFAREPVSVNDLSTQYYTVSCIFVADLYPGFVLDSGFRTIFIRGDAATISSPVTLPPSAPTITVTGLTAGVTADGFVSVSGVGVGSSWQRSVDSGVTWQAGTGGGFRLPEATYAAGAIQVRQTGATGLTSPAAQNASPVTVAPPNSVVLAFTAAPGAVTTGTTTLPLVGRIVRVVMSHAGWLTLYGSTAARSADATRAATTEPARGSGVCADPRLAVGGTINFNPFADFRNEETPATTTYPWKHVNEGNATQNFVIILTFITS